MWPMGLLFHSHIFFSLPLSFSLFPSHTSQSFLSSLFSTPHSPSLPLLSTFLLLTLSLTSLPALPLSHFPSPYTHLSPSLSISLHSPHSPTPPYLPPSSLTHRLSPSLPLSLPTLYLFSLSSLSSYLHTLRLFTPSLSLSLFLSLSLPHFLRPSFLNLSLLTLSLLALSLYLLTSTLSLSSLSPTLSSLTLSILPFSSLPLLPTLTLSHSSHSPTLSHSSHSPSLFHSSILLTLSPHSPHSPTSPTLFSHPTLYLSSHSLFTLSSLSHSSHSLPTLPLLTLSSHSPTPLTLSFTSLSVPLPLSLSLSHWHSYNSYNKKMNTKTGLYLLTS